MKGCDSGRARHSVRAVAGLRESGGQRIGPPYLGVFAPSLPPSSDFGETIRSGVVGRALAAPGGFTFPGLHFRPDGRNSGPVE